METKRSETWLRVRCSGKLLPRALRVWGSHGWLGRRAVVTPQVSDPVRSHILRNVLRVISHPSCEEEGWGRCRPHPTGFSPHPACLLGSQLALGAPRRHLHGWCRHKCPGDSEEEPPPGAAVRGSLCQLSSQAAACRAGEKSQPGLLLPAAATPPRGSETRRVVIHSFPPRGASRVWP